VAVLAANSALAQSRAGSVQESPFVPGESRIYDDKGALVGTAQESPFVPGEVRLYDREGKPTGIETRPNAFDPNRTDVFDDGADKDR
jgi:hypothetical protein